MQAQLGNQMFQYAAIRTYAESTASAFLWGYPATKLADQMRLCIGRMRRHPIRLRQYFALDGDSRIRQLQNKVIWRLRRLLRPAHIVLPEYEEVFPKAFSEKVMNLASLPREQDLEFRGWFQTEQYFLPNRSNILNWFAPVESVRREIDKAEQRLRVPPEQRCCIHVRRGDYLQCDAGFAGPEGWALPMAYYQNAWATVPAGIVPIVITDDPAYCQENFGWLPNVQIVRDTTAIVDLFLMRNSRYKIIANSTFSWWGAWLSEAAEGVTFVPEGFLGFVRHMWAPSHIKPETWISVHCDADAPATQTLATSG